MKNASLRLSQLTPVAVILTRYSDGRYVDVNETFLRLFDYKREEVIGHTSPEINIFLSPNGRAEFLRALEAKGHIRDLDMSFQTKTGKIVQTIISSEKIILNDQDHILTTLVDITERKNAEEKLRASEERYHFLFSNMMDGFAFCKMIFDKENKPVDFIYLEINEAFERITGLKRDLVIGKKVTQAIPGIKEANPELFEIYGRVASSCREEKFEVFFKPLSLWLSISVYCPSKGFFAAIFEDVTERKNAEQELWRAKNDWERTFDTVPDFIAILDKKHRIVRANKAMAQQLGVTPEQAEGENCYKCVHGTSLPPEFCPHSKTIQDGKEHVAEVYEPRLGGDFLVSTTPP